VEAAASGTLALDSSWARRMEGNEEDGVPWRGWDRDSHAGLENRGVVESVGRRRMRGVLECF